MTVSAHVHIVDDDSSIRDSLNFLVRSVGWQPHIYSSAKEFLEKFVPCGEDCLLLDIQLPEMNGLELHRLLRERNVDISTIIMTGHGDIPMAVEAMKNGAIDFIQKPFKKDLLLDNVYKCLEINRKSQVRNQQRAENNRKLATLTVRENEVLEHLLRGQQNKVIAADLGISARTVEIHRANIMSKLKVKSLPELVKMALSVEKPEDVATAHDVT